MQNYQIIWLIIIIIIITEYQSIECIRIICEGL